ncbi:MAG: hypothetical protein H8E61_06555 [Bacteroidetes bacterium]|nr:hypothetical protein [Bacteroidota bacterium]
MTIVKFEKEESTPQTIRINPEFEKLIPALEPKERQGLEENILKNGCYDAIKLWNGTIVDGHNRYHICSKHNLPFKQEAVTFADEKEAKVWIIDLQLDRRNISVFARGTLVMKKEHILFTSHRGERTDLQNNDLTSVTIVTEVKSLIEKDEAETEAEKLKKCPTRKAAKTAGISHNTYAKIKYLHQHSTDEELKSLEEGKLSVSACYEDVKKRERKIVDFPDEKIYEVFYCDPYARDLTSPSGWRRKNFITQPAHLPVGDVASTLGSLFLWTPVHFLERSLELMKTWGFSYSGMIGRS